LSGRTARLQGAAYEYLNLGEADLDRQRGPLAAPHSGKLFPPNPFLQCYAELEILKQMIERIAGMPCYRLWLPTLVVCNALIAAAGLPRAGAQELSNGDVAAINTLLGSDVLGVALPASPIADPTTLIPLHQGSWVFQVSSGPNQGTTEIDTLQPNTQPGADSRWQYSAGQGAIYDLGQANDGSIVSPSGQDLSRGVLTRYDPPRPVLLAGMRPGVPQTSTEQVNVFDLSDPDTVTHTGSLTLTITYVGRYQVTVPAGTYAAALIKWQYNGEVGPASIADTEYRFFADGIGPIAVIDKQSMSAFFIYSKNTKYGKVLAATGPE
jgi:hypothetical protein